MTIRSFATAALPIALAAFLSGCGGSDGGNVTSVLNPPSSGTVNSTLSNGLVSERFPAQASRLSVGSSAQGAVTSATAQSTAYGTMAIAYNATSGSYTLSDSGTSSVAVFGPADTTVSTAAFRRYVTGSDTLSLLVNAGTNPRISLSYVTYGAWTQTPAGGPAVYRTAIAGVQTAYGNVPRTGSADYTGIVDGYWSDGATVRRLLGSTGTFSANFETGGVGATLVLSGTSDLGDSAAGARTALGTYQGLGSITAGTNQFSGNLGAPINTTAPSTPGYTGTYQGAFFGPTAQEAGLSFTLQNANAANASVSGVLVGKR